MGIYYAQPMLRLAKWTAMKDFHESCVEDRGSGLSSAACNATLAEAVRPPPIVKRTHAGIIEQILTRYLNVLVTAATGITTVVAFVIWFRRHMETRPKPQLSLVRIDAGCYTTASTAPRWLEEVKTLPVELPESMGSQSSEPKILKFGMDQVSILSVSSTTKRHSVASSTPQADHVELDSPTSTVDSPRPWEDVNVHEQLSSAILELPMSAASATASVTDLLFSPDAQSAVVETLVAKDETIAALLMAHKTFELPYLASEVFEVIQTLETCTFMVEHLLKMSPVPSRLAHDWEAFGGWEERMIRMARKVCDICGRLRTSLQPFQHNHNFRKRTLLTLRWHWQMNRVLRLHKDLLRMQEEVLKGLLGEWASVLEQKV